MNYKDIIHNVRIYDLNESLIAAGYPMRTKIQNMDEPFLKKDLERAKSLTKAVKNDNQAHGQFLTGIRVSFDLTFTNKAWVEAERYRFLEFVSSQSTMYCITKFDIDNQYIEYTDKRMIEIMKELIKEYNENPSSENYLKVLYSNPCGFKITARMTTNYRCLMNIYQQRKSHRLLEWRAFCEWIKSLPYSELITGEEV
ncbi:MAG: hypothetical protein NC247_06445 [Ruminococcus flavefaciens]|nr:hypothetical protein [Ruminococcus flavefaciens]MCM1361945.1 hypothetical protein [Clostridiales bacterium]